MAKVSKVCTTAISRNNPKLDNFKKGLAFFVSPFFSYEAMNYNY